MSRKKNSTPVEDKKKLPLWLVVARGHSRGQDNLGITVYDQDQLVDTTRRLREYGYKEVKSMPINRGSTT